MNGVDAVRGELRRSLSGEAWHGPALLEALGDVTEMEAFARPVAGAHTIAELALHTLAWTEEVTRRLGGGTPREPERGDWPEPARMGSDGWGEIGSRLGEAGAALDRVLVDLTPERLEWKVPAAEAAPASDTGVTYRAMLHGLAQHNAYHGGQITLLKLAQRRGAAL